MKFRHHLRRSLLLLATGLPAAVLAGPAATEPDRPAASGAGSLLERETLTGDWGGLRSGLRDRGVDIDLFYSGYYLGLSGADAPEGFEWGNRLDALVDFDLEKLGLWEGGSFHTHLTYRWGASGYRGGALWPVSSALELPQVDANELVASSLYFRQKIGPATSIALGKMNVVDFVANDPHFGGWGITRFMNLSAMLPPSGLFPPVIIGGQLNHRVGDYGISFFVYDTDDRSGDYFPDDLFAEGVNFSLTGSWSGKLWGRSTGIAVNGTFSTETGADLRDAPIAPGLVDTSTKEGSWAASVQLSHLLVPSPVKPETGLWLYLKALKGDGNPNYVEGYFSGGISGHGMVPGRPDDYFGIAGFYFAFSKDLRSSISPLVNIENEKGVEAYYMASLTPWLRAGINLQWIDPGLGANSDFFAASVRTVITF